MDEKGGILKGKKVLIVDDEPDVLDTLQEILDMCEVVRAGTFEEAKKQLESRRFDLAVLDIMGVNGYELLQIAVAKNVTAVMLTAHALTPEDTVKSFKGGAAHFVPKDKIGDMETILSDILEAIKKGKSSWVPFMGWADAYYKAKFGPRWEDRDKEFWKKFRQQA
jgi:DNA-binding NtrC family response regulator